MEYNNSLKSWLQVYVLVMGQVHEMKGCLKTRSQISNTLFMSPSSSGLVLCFLDNKEDLQMTGPYLCHVAIFMLYA